MINTKIEVAKSSYGTTVLRGGRMTKWKGKAASISPSLGQLIASVSPVALGRALMLGANRTATAAVLGGVGLIVTTSGASAACTNTSGTVFVWHARFESSRNNEMGKFASKYTDFLSSINKRIVDLEDPFKFEYITDPAFEGKSSIKKILPAMINNFSYEDLDIKEGLSAGKLWKEATFNKISVQSREKIYSDLELYCERDTYAMVLIHEELNRLLR